MNDATQKRGTKTETSIRVLDWVIFITPGATIAAICAETFFLAETGLLDGKRTTTHWGLADEFRRRYPRVRLDPNLLIADEGRLLSSGACTSYIDLAVYLEDNGFFRKLFINQRDTGCHTKWNKQK